MKSKEVSTVACDFKVTLTLKRFYLKGLRALEMRRSLGFEDGVALSTRGSRPSPVSVRITESMARLWFEPEQCEDEVAIPVELLNPGQLELVDSYLELRHDLPEEDLLELYVMAKISELMGQLTKVTEECDRLRAQNAPKNGK